MNIRHILDLRFVNGEGIASRRTVQPYNLVAHRDRCNLLEHFAGADYRYHVVLRISGTEQQTRRHHQCSVCRLERLDLAEMM